MRLVSGQMGQLNVDLLGAGVLDQRGQQQNNNTIMDFVRDVGLTCADGHVLGVWPVGVALEVRGRQSADPSPKVDTASKG